MTIHMTQHTISMSWDDEREPHELVDSAWDAVLTGRPRDALRLAAQVVARAISSDTGGSPDTANAWAAVAAAGLALADYDLASAGSELAHDLSGTYLPSDDDGIRRLCFEVVLLRARALRATGAFGAALTLLMHLGEARLQPNGPVGDAATYLNELGITYKFDGKPALALSCYQQATLADVKRSRDFAATLHHNVGGAYHALGELELAERHARDGLALRHEVSPDDELAIAADEVALSAILVDASTLDEADALLDTALARYSRRLPPGHYEIAFATMLRARVALDRGDPERAATLGGAAVGMFERGIGADHPDTAYARASWALALSAVGRDDRAHREADRAVNALIASLGEHHPRTQDALALASAFRQRERRES